ncbi:Ig-like domain-containing protein [Morganella morganii]|uniref:Ig-like domain-containing protein n=1 Tax=Morganella morganii TaxID=582 RepID=UPI003EC12A01
MTEKYNQAEVKGHNFISDPYFEEWGNGDWEKGDPNRYTKKRDGDKTYLFISGKGSVSQSVTLPKKSSGKPGKPPFYSLTFDYSIKNKASVSLILTYLSGGSERNKEEITLPDKKEWSQYELLLDVSAEDTEIRFEFYAGKSAGNKGLNLTAVDMQLHIGGLNPESIVFENKNIPADKPLLRFNYGHKHVLNIKPTGDSAWRDLNCALKWGSDVSEFHYPVSFIPELNIAQPLNEEGSIWEISCSTQKVSGIPETFNVMLASEYSSEPFIFSAEIGDYLYKFTEPKISGIAVIAQSIPANLSIRVVCDYDDGYPDMPGVPDIDVRWSIDGGEVITATKTDADGMAALTFLPEKSGNYKLSALITDKTGRESRHPFDIHVYDRSPWLDDTRVAVNNTDIDLSGEAGYLMNGTVTALHLNCDKNRNVFGLVKLENKAGNTGVTITPAEGREIPPEGLSWDLNITGDDSRELAFLLTSDQFGISQEIRVIALQPDTGKEIKSLKINGEEINEKTPLIVAPAESITLNCTVNKLLSRLQAELNSKDSKTLTAEPAFGQLQALKNNAAQWKLHSINPQGGFFDLALNLPPLTNPLTLSGRVLPQEIASGIETITLNATPVTAPGDFFLAPDKKYTLTIKPHPLLKGIPVSLVSETGNGVTVISHPPFGQEISLAENGSSWQLSADPSSARGKFALHIQSQWGGAPVHLSGSVLSADLQDEGSVRVIDGNIGTKYDIDFNIGFAFLAFELYTLGLKLLPDNLISGQTVSWEVPEGDHHRDAVSFDPKTPVALDLSGTKWEFSYTKEDSTQFDLLLNSPGKFSYKTPCHIFSDEKYLEKKQCLFKFNGSDIIPGVEYNKAEYKKDILIELKLSREVSEFLNGMVLALIVHKMDDEGDSLIITSEEKITVDENKSDLEWTVKTDVAVGHRFTLEVVLDNLKDIRSVMKFISV